MKSITRILLMAVLITFVSTAAFAQRAEYKKLNQRMALLYKNGRNTEAIDVAKEIIALADKEFGKEHAYYAASLSNIAMLYFKEGDFKTAKAKYMEVLSLKESSLGKDNPQLVKVLKDIKKCCDELGESDESQKIKTRLEAIQRSTSG